MKKIISVVGARPNFMKVAPIHRAFLSHADTVKHMIVHTGQHYDASMSKIFFEDLELPNPDIYLGVGSGSHAQQTAKIMTGFESIVEHERPDHVVVVGDVNSTLACTLVAAKMNVRVSHVEAGLRSFDRKMPEEINRLATDVLANYLFVSEPSGLKNLKREGIEDGKVFFVGNVMIDSLVYYRQKAAVLRVAQRLGLREQNYVLVTLHRPSNVDDGQKLTQIIDALSELANRIPVVFPVHPRTRKMIQQFSLESKVRSTPNLILGEPLGYLEFLSLMATATLLVTDSGGIQEETTYLEIPCLTLRENTERPVTVEIGTNELCGENPALLLSRAHEILDGQRKKNSIPELWDGHAAERIVSTVTRQL